MEKPVILFEDNHVIVAVKPPNLLTQADNTGDPDLLSQIKEYVKETYNKPGEAYIGLVHRMDRPVGGLLVFARTSKAAARLSEQVRTKELHRHYVCVVEGNPPDQFRLEDYLLKDMENNRVKVVSQFVSSDAKKAVLYGRTIARCDGLALVAIELETGRAHQIRVQMQHAGYPLWGDNRYGNGKPGQQIALWGFRLAFDHPITKEHMLFMSPVPEKQPWLTFAVDLKLLENIWPQIRPAMSLDGAKETPEDK